MVSRPSSRPLNWETDDLALQNIQARARSPGVWLLANLRGSLLVVDQQSKRSGRWLRHDGWRHLRRHQPDRRNRQSVFAPLAACGSNSDGPEGIGPIPALRAVNRQEPTAELRPSAAGQTDEADLMPYELLDAIERAAIRDKRSPLEVFQLMQADFPQYTAEQLLAWVERFFRLWCRNQWKRERYAPSFHVDDENLDPKTWCRFPILSGGFERELAELRAYVKTQVARGEGAGARRGVVTSHAGDTLFVPCSLPRAPCLYLGALPP